MHRLDQIIAQGSPAQSALAAELRDGPQELIDLLYDAYLNDPYLVRT